jgi:hypothetical protein
MTQMQTEMENYVYARNQLVIVATLLEADVHRVDQFTKRVLQLEDLHGKTALTVINIVEALNDLVRSRLPPVEM